MENTDRPQQVMVIFAHPDDAEFMAAGTVAKWAREGKEIIYVVCTDGSKGSNEPDMSPEQLIKIRKQEQQAAAKVLGVKEVIFLGHEDGTLEPNLALRKDLTRLIRHYRPAIAICGDPAMWYAGGRYFNHPDHRAAAQAAVDAIALHARNRPSFPELFSEGLEPHSVKEVYLSDSVQPDVWIDISDTIDLKIAALKEHNSQLLDEGGRLEAMIRHWAQETAKGQDMVYAEGFKRFQLAGWEGDL